MTQRPMSFSRTPLLASLCAAAVLTACGGDGGSFYLTLSCTGAATEKEAVPANIAKINIRFQPGKGLKTAIAAAAFKPAADLAK